jgi:HSP20 family protein
MAITPYRSSSDPFDRLFDALSGTGFGRTSGLMRTPETDVVETEREIRVHTEMPGLKRDDIEIDVENNVLTIRGEKREERTEGQEGKYHIAERRYGTLTRSFVLPRDVDSENIQASFEDGVLNVTIPKSEQARRRRIEVRGGGEAGQEVGGGQRGSRQQGESQGQSGMQAQGSAERQNQ